METVESNERKQAVWKGSSQRAGYSRDLGWGRTKGLIQKGADAMLVGPDGWSERPSASRFKGSQSGRWFRTTGLAQGRRENGYFVEP